MDDSAQLEIALLTRNHQRDGFDCGNLWLNTYLTQRSLNHQALGYGRTYVATKRASPVVEAFYTLSMTSVSFENLPDELKRKAPKFPMPVAAHGLPCRWAVHSKKGIGSILLIDAFRRVLAAAEQIGARAMDVKAIDDPAKQWYERQGFKPFLDDPHHLYIALETVRAAVAASG